MPVAPHAAARATQRALDPLILLPPLVAAALFATGNPNFGFDRPGWLDAFVYVGYFWHYTDHLAIFDEYYKASRLPWVLPGFISHRLFGEIAGSYVLHWVTLSGSGVALYLLLRDALKAPLVACIAAAAWVTSTQGHGVGGWNYHILASAGYYLLASWLSVRAAAPTAGRHVPFFCGVALACAVHAHLFYLVFVPLLVPLYLVCRPSGFREWRRIAVDLGWVVAGGVAVTVLLGAVNAATGGTWLFFMPQVRYTLWISETGNPWWFEAETWLPSARYLVVPVLCVAAGTAALLRRVGESDAVRLAFVAQAWIAGAIFTYYQFVARQSVLDHDYMAFGIYCHAFPALAVAMQRSSHRATGAATHAPLLAASVLVMAGVLLLGLPARLAPTLTALTAAAAGGLPPLAVPLMAGFAGIGAATLLPRRSAVVAFAVWFGLMNVWLTPAPDAYGFRTAGVQRSMMKLFREADRFTGVIDPSLNGIEYWFTSEPIQTSQGVLDLADVFDSFVSTRGWLGNLLLEQSPAPPVEEIRMDALANVYCIGVLSSVERHPEARQTFTDHFDANRRPLLEIATREFSTPELAFALTVFKVPAAESRPIQRGSAAACLPHDR